MPEGMSGTRVPTRPLGLGPGRTGALLQHAEEPRGVITGRLSDRCASQLLGADAWHRRGQGSLVRGCRGQPDHAFGDLELGLLLRHGLQLELEQAAGP